jgi:hypothetical protein
MGSTSGRNAIVWLFAEAPLSPNVLFQLDRAVVDRIFAQKSGQQKINELFRNALGRRVGRAVVATVAQQPDYMKRVRKNGGARSALQSEGILILGQYHDHGTIAQHLGVAVPAEGESVSVRVTPAGGPGPGVAEISGGFWRVAQPTDRIVPAPDLPTIKPAHSARRP